eukprot:TRINITY_DN4947_c0_g1_i1.p1 TRINITY_DN4947_c0_g1~~TRINITY_DN4947_c0_g1_i1.p1  ORF type:complete len:715 (+),score=247.21 TRINITY_DN4947_c0_g1_i1:82-2145(+)
MQEDSPARSPRIIPEVDPPGYGAAAAAAAAAAATAECKSRDGSPRSPLDEAGAAWQVLLEQFARLDADGAMVTGAQHKLRTAMQFRRRYALRPRLLPQTAEPVARCSFSPEAVCQLHTASGAEGPQGVLPVPSIQDFVADFEHLKDICADGGTRSYAHQRLRFLERSFGMFCCSGVSSVKLGLPIGADGPVSGSMCRPNDFYSCAKVDVHIHSAAAFSPCRLLTFMRDKWHRERDTVVLRGKTLGQICGENRIDLSKVTVRCLGVHAGAAAEANELFTRFDAFNAKYSPMGASDLRDIFLKTGGNDVKGRFFAELLLQVIHTMEMTPDQHAELRVSIYGKSKREWVDLARWMQAKYQAPCAPPEGRNMISERVGWMVQVPRIFRVLSRNRVVSNFAEWTENVFDPMFQATLRPEEHPEVAWMLRHIRAMDSVDDESAPEMDCRPDPPAAVTGGNPGYSYQLYLLWANLHVLNCLRQSKGLNVIHLRPHAGEAGDTLHLHGAFLLARGINHGVQLARGDGMQAAIQYLYYLGQIGLGLSPLSNHFLFKKLHDESQGQHPIAKFLRRGLNVTISTDDPLMFHLTDTPLMEEYAVVRAAFGLSREDLAEFARNSVLQSSFPESWKREKLGAGPDFNPDCGFNGLLCAHFCDHHATLVPQVRAEFRVGVLRHELKRIGIQPEEFCRPNGLI